MLATKAAPGIETRQSGSRGLTAQTRSVAIPTAMSGNCQTHADNGEVFGFAEIQCVND